MSLREVVSHIIEDLDVSDAEEEMANAVSRVERGMSGEGKKLFQHCRGMEFSGPIKPRSLSGDLHSKLRRYCAVDAGGTLIEVMSEPLSISRQVLYKEAVTHPCASMSPFACSRWLQTESVHQVFGRSVVGLLLAQEG